MKVLYIMSLLISIPFSNAYSKDYVSVIDKDKIVGKISVESLKTLTATSEKYKEIMDAQNKKRVIIEVIDAVTETDIKHKYQTKIRISWIKEDGQEINYITANVFLTIINEGDVIVPEWRLVYRDVSEIGFPICGGLLIIVLIILL